MKKRKQPKGKTSKKLREHFRLRWSQRIGEFRPPFRLINKAIKNNGFIEDQKVAISLGRQSVSRSAWLIKWKDQDYKVIYDRKRKHVVTIFKMKSVTE